MLRLNLDKKTEEQFNKLLNLHNNNYSDLIKSLIDYRVHELQKGIHNIELDFAFYEKKYNINSNEFYTKYENGDFGDESHNKDFMIWSSEYESYNDFKAELEKLA